MSSTRHATDSGPIRQERYASNDAYRTGLGGLLVAKRCGMLSADPELTELIWFIQWRSLTDHFLVGGNTGSVESLADALLTDMHWQPPVAESVWVEDQETGKMDLVEQRVDHQSARSTMVAELAAGLRTLALNPVAPPESLPGLGSQWRSVLKACRSHFRSEIQRGLAPTIVAKRIAESLRFARETHKPVLITGRSRLGKSAAAKAFCAASGGMARYVLTPEDSDMDSFYRAVAKSLGVADSHSRKASEVRDLIERMLMSSGLMLVLDEAHNLFSGLRRIARLPQRVLWLRRLIDANVPVALLALPEFEARVKRYIEQLDWDAAQITDLICRREELPEALDGSDFELLIERLAPALTSKAKSMLAGAAAGQRGAQYIVDTLAVAGHAAGKFGRTVATDEEIAEAIGERPQFFRVKAPRGSRIDPAPIAQVKTPADAVRLRGYRMGSANSLQPAIAG